MSNTRAPLPRFVRTVLRLVSLVLAAGTVAVIVFYPRLIATDTTAVPHGALVLMLLAMSLCWVHGFGLTITNRWLRWVFSPLVAWPLMALGAWGVFLR